MRKVLALGAAVLFVGSVSVAVAQERLQSNQSGMGVGEGVGERVGTSAWPGCRGQSGSSTPSAKAASRSCLE